MEGNLNPQVWTSQPAPWVDVRGAHASGTAAGTTIRLWGAGYAFLVLPPYYGPHDAATSNVPAGFFDRDRAYPLLTPYVRMLRAGAFGEGFGTAVAAGTMPRESIELPATVGRFGVGPFSQLDLVMAASGSGTVWVRVFTDTPDGRMAAHVAAAMVFDHWQVSAEAAGNSVRMVEESPAPNASSNAIAVGLGATLIVVARANRKHLIVSKKTAGTIYVGEDAGVTLSHGVPLIMGAATNSPSLAFPNYAGALYGIAYSAAQDVGYIEYW